MKTIYVESIVHKNEKRIKLVFTITGYPRRSIIRILLILIMNSSSTTGYPFLIKIS